MIAAPERPERGLKPPDRDDDLFFDAILSLDPSQSRVMPFKPSPPVRNARVSDTAESRYSQIGLAEFGLIAIPFNDLLVVG